MIDEKILRLNQLGIIPGPEENLDAFLVRADYCLNLGNELNSKMAESSPFSEHTRASVDVLKESFPITSRFYDIQPEWIPLFFSDYKLFPWHGGCAWIFQEKEDSPTGAFFQLRTSFKNSKTYLGLYKRDALIAHELSHVGRMLFEERRFEEVFAYRSDPSFFRRYFGPIMQSSWESALFMIFLLAIMLVDLSLSTFAEGHALWLKLVPFGMIIYALGRLFRKQRQFGKCLKNIKDIVGDETKANGAIYRLTDKEIIAISKMSQQSLLNYFKTMKGSSLRWEVIDEAYLGCCRDTQQ